jgi:hypothetical protein
MNFAKGKRQRRLYENTAMVAVRQERAIDLFWTRRGRKSTTLGNIAFDELSVGPGRTVISASASLLLGTELVHMTTTAAEQAILITQEAEAQAIAFTEGAGGGKDGKELKFECANAETGKVYQNLSREQYVDLYVSKRLEMRLYFNQNDYSRQMVIAPNPATARGWGGTVFRDEAGFTRPEVEIELQMAVDPIFRTDPSFKMIKASNLSRDDRHPFFEETMPPVDMKFPPNPAGHFYRGQNGILIHRVSLADAYAAGHVLYDNKGKEMTYDQFCADPANRIQLPFNYQLIHVAGGTSVIDLMAMLTAQSRGLNQCAFVMVDSDADFLRALQLLAAKLGDGKVGIGVDVGTTTEETSNPTSVTVTEKKSLERIARLIICWKEKRESVQRDRLRQIVDTVRRRPTGGPAVRMCIDATSERFFAEGTREKFRGIIPVELIISSNSVDPLPPGYRDAINYKTYLGDLYSSAVNENHYALPSNKYVKDDQRMVLKSGGRYVCTPDNRDGKHGDTFDSGKLAEFALMAGGGPFNFERVHRVASDRVSNKEVGI